MHQPGPFRTKKHSEESTESWLMSYADMITLLLCFFIIFVSTSEPKQDDLAAATRGLQARFGSVDLSTPFQGAFRSIQGVIDQNAAQQAMSVEKTERGLQIEISTTTYYMNDSADFHNAQIPVLNDVIKDLKIDTFKKYRIIIEGHTDDTPIAQNNRYPSNWELSSARASRMVRLFIEQGFEPERLEAIGYAGTRPRLPNIDRAGQPIESNRERNRRVVIKLEQRF